MSFIKYPKKFKEYGLAGKPKVNWKLDFCKVYFPCEDCTLTGGGEKCEYGKSRKWYDSLPTREQAIEKMAKAIYGAMCPNFLQMFIGWRAYTKISKVALNALLEGHNDKR